MKHKIYKSKNSAFSLVELMISLITVSLISAAFAPVISKKLSKSMISLTSSSPIKLDCSTIDSDCNICNGTSCLLCNKNCGTGKYKNNSRCKCLNCTTLNCAECTSSTCTKCQDGYYLENNECKVCPKGQKCPNGKTQELCPVGYYQNEEKQTTCKTCTGNQYQNEEGKETCKTCNSGNYIPSSTANSSCLACNSNCTLCSENANNCSSCKANYFLLGSSCLNCPNNATCAGGTNSFICNTNYTKSGLYCAFSCPSGKYISGTSCLTCPSNATCNGTSVITCKSGYALSGTTCVKEKTTCNSNQYISGSNCLTCPNNATCDGTNFTCNSGYEKNNGSCVSTKQIPVCENAALCEFSGDINGDWLLTVNAASDRAGETKIRFYENINVDIFVNGSGGGGPGTGSDGHRWACFGISTTVKQYAIEAGDYSASVGKGGKGTSNWSPTLGSKTIFKTPDGTVIAEANGAPGWSNSRMNCYASSKRTKSFNEDTGTFYGSGGASATSSWAAGKDGKDGVLLIRNQRF